jgi:hypothetical protein
MTRGRTAFVSYLAISLLYFGVPVAAHPGRDWVGSGADPQIFVWSLAWWPHAIIHWQDPIVSHSVWPPVGLDLAWVSSIPGLALALAPVTLLAGPVVAYNVASILVPALAAWTAFLLCRHVSRSFWPSLAGGYLFGFSSYMLGHLEGHLHMSSVFLVPLVALVVLRYVEGSLGGRGFGLRLGLLLAGQLLLSTEVLFTLTLALVASLVCAFGLVPGARPRLRWIPLPLAGGYLLAGVLTSPLLAHAAAHFTRESINKPDRFPADLANLVVPTKLTAFSTAWTRHTSHLFAGNTAENGAYLGLPLLAILIWLAWTKRRTAGGRFLACVFALGLLFELGTALRVAGERSVTLPWRGVVGLPGFNNVLPVRFSLYVALVAAVAAAWWAASAPTARWVRVLLTALAITAILPRLWLDAWHAHPYRPTFFTTSLRDRCLPSGATVLTLPYASQTGAMLWQAESGFRYRMANASLSPLVPDGVPDKGTALALVDNDTPPGGVAAIVHLARAQGVDVILVTERHGKWHNLLAAAGLRTKPVGNVNLYRPDGTLASCRSPSGPRGGSNTSSRRTNALAAFSANPSLS